MHGEVEVHGQCEVHGGRGELIEFSQAKPGAGSASNNHGKKRDENRVVISGGMHTIVS